MIVKPKLLLLGYSGKRNLGDDLLLRQAWEEFKEIAEIHIHTSVLDNNSDYLKKWFPESFIHKKLKLDYFFLKGFSHVLYFGGGVFFNYNKVSFKYYIKKRISILRNYRWTKNTGVKFAGIGIGLGPFASRRSRYLCFKQLENFDFLNLRDKISAELYKQSGAVKVSLSEDLSLARYSYYRSFKIPRSKRSREVIICPREYPHGEKKNHYLKNLFEICNSLKSSGREISVFGFQSNHDEAVMNAFSEKGFSTCLWNPDKMEVEDVFRAFAKCEFVISARMHGVYISGMLDVPVIGIGVHQKLKTASDLFSQSICLPDDFKVNEMKGAIERMDKLEENDFSKLVDVERKCRDPYRLVSNWIRNEGGGAFD